MKTVFLGSGEYARDLLQHLIDSGFELAGLITRPDSPAGRGLRRRPTPIRSLAEKVSLEVRQPSRPDDPEFTAALRELETELLLVSDYGFILARAVLDFPQYGCVNVHPSLLPRYRGAAPIRRALMEGETKTGVSLMRMDEGLDTGPVIAQEEERIEQSDDAGTMREKLASLGARMALDFIPLYTRGSLEVSPQEDTRASYAEPIGKEDLLIDWSQSAQRVFNQVRALSPKPGAYTYLGGRRIKILRALPRDRVTDLPQRMLKVEAKDVLLAGTGEGALELQRIQPEGKKAMSSGEFLRGYRLGQCEYFADAAT